MSDGIIIPFHQIRFCTDVVLVDWNGGTEKKFALVSVAKTIYSKDSRIKKEVKKIHNISEFIMYKYSSREYNTMKKNCDNLCVFLNYLVQHSRELNVTDLTELNLSHGTSFLNYLSRTKNLSRSTIKIYERTLTNFYAFLSRKGLIPLIPDSKFVKKEDLWGRSYYLSPFKGIQYPSSKPLKKEHVFPMKYFPILLEIAVQEAPRIALGIYLQFFGGLRAGEVVNLSRTQAKRRVKNGDFLLNIKKRNFRIDIKDRSSSSVKREREQEIFNIKDWLPTLFDDHLERFKPNDRSNALFVNRDGKAMTAKSYSQYFKKVKEFFCTYLKLYGDDEDIVVSDHLRVMNWSTHIGRGTFTNMIAENTDNPFLLAYKRGDSNPDSALPYMAKTARLREKIETKFAGLNNEYLPKLVESRKENHNKF